MRKVIALIMATLMVVAMAFSAFAVNITITRDGSYDSGTGGSGTGNLYQYYLIFTAVSKNASGTTTGGGSGSFGYQSGTEWVNNGIGADHQAVAYTASATVAAKLGSWNAETKTWTPASGNDWFTLTPIADGDDDASNDTYSVEWTATTTDFATIQAAAEWLVNNKAYEEGYPVAFDFDETKKAWTTDDLLAGYYVIAGATGKNLIAATTDITIKEKNVYPSLEKTEADEDNTSFSSGTRNVAVGDIITYQIEVKVPSTAKNTDWIVITDTASSGLEIVSMPVESGTSVNPVFLTPWTSGTNPNPTWTAKISTSGTQGKTIKYVFDMRVTEAALVDTEKKNSANLEYGNSGTSTFETKPSEVEYETYFAGIHKFDGDESGTDLEGVEFALTRDGEIYYVKKSGTFYYPVSSGTEGASGTVITDKNGMIIIRGLDKDKEDKYVLTEIKTLPGYNMLSGTVDLTLYLDPSGTSGSVTDLKTTSTWGQIANFSGTILPSTGGIGTTIFYIVGGLLAVGAGVVLVAKKRMGKVED